MGARGAEGPRRVDKFNDSGMLSTQAFIFLYAICVGTVVRQRRETDADHRMAAIKTPYIRRARCSALSQIQTTPSGNRWRQMPK